MLAFFVLTSTAMAWIEPVMTLMALVSTFVNLYRTHQYWERSVGPVFFPRGVLSGCYVLAYIAHWIPPVSPVTEPGPVLLVILALAAWPLVWIMPALMYKPIEVTL